MFLAYNSNLDKLVFLAERKTNNEEKIYLKNIYELLIRNFRIITSLTCKPDSCHNKLSYQEALKLPIVLTIEDLKEYKTLNSFENYAILWATK